MPSSARLQELSLWTITLQSMRTGTSLVQHRQAVTSTSTSPIEPAKQSGGCGRCVRSSAVASSRVALGVSAESLFV
jgi:hypothetical protein